jgi:16S rRNA (uracil1498-N3)-methyltransferase
LLLDAEGALYELVIERLEKSRLTCLLKNIRHDPPARGVSIRLGLALIKIDRFEWCIEKSCELGADEIVPVLTGRCVARAVEDEKGEARLSGKLKRWQAIAREAAEQCERTAVPPVVRPEPLADFLCGRGGGMEALRYICVERSHAAPLAKALASKIYERDLPDAEGIKAISLLVGPEGGFTDDEIALALKQEWMPVSLGPRILRSETAAIVAMAQVASVLDI